MAFKLPGNHRELEENFRRQEEKADRRKETETSQAKYSSLTVGMTAEQAEKTVGHRLAPPKSIPHGADPRFALADKRLSQAVEKSAGEGVHVLLLGNVIEAIHYADPYVVKVGDIRVGDRTVTVRERMGEPIIRNNNHLDWIYPGGPGGCDMHVEIKDGICTGIMLERYVPAAQNGTEAGKDSFDWSKAKAAASNLRSGISGIASKAAPVAGVAFRKTGRVLGIGWDKLRDLWGRSAIGGKIAIIFVAAFAFDLLLGATGCVAASCRSCLSCDSKDKPAQVETWEPESESGGKSGWLTGCAGCSGKKDEPQEEYFEPEYPGQNDIQPENQTSETPEPENVITGKPEQKPSEEADSTGGKKLSELTREEKSTNSVFGFEYFEFVKDKVSDGHGFTYEGDNIGMLEVGTGGCREVTVRFAFGDDFDSSKAGYIAGVLAYGGDTTGECNVSFYADYGDVIGVEDIGTITIYPFSDPKKVCIAFDEGCEGIIISVNTEGRTDLLPGNKIIFSDFRLYVEDPSESIELPKYQDEQTGLDNDTKEKLERAGKNGRRINDSRVNVVFARNVGDYGQSTFVDCYEDEQYKINNSNICILKPFGLLGSNDTAKLCLNPDSRSYRYVGGIIYCAGTKDYSVRLTAYSLRDGEKRQLGEPFMLEPGSEPAVFCVPVDEPCTTIYFVADNVEDGISGELTNKIILYDFRLFKEDPTQLLNDELAAFKENYRK